MKLPAFALLAPLSALTSACSSGDPGPTDEQLTGGSSSTAGGSSSTAGGSSSTAGGSSSGGAAASSDGDGGSGTASGGSTSSGGRLSMGSGGGTGDGGASESGGTGGDTCEPNVACKLARLPTTGDAKQDCVDRINQFRAECLCLPPLERWSEGESCADEQAEYDTTRPPHSGFSDRICDPRGQAQNECPGWGSVDQVIGGCLQAMWDEGPPPTPSCNDDCFLEHGHFLSMSSTQYTKVACGFAESAQGEVWAVQNFSR